MVSPLSRGFIFNERYFKLFTYAVRTDSPVTLKLQGDETQLYETLELLENASYVKEVRVFGPSLVTPCELQGRTFSKWVTNWDLTK